MEIVEVFLSLLQDFLVRRDGVDKLFFFFKKGFWGGGGVLKNETLSIKYFYWETV